MTVVKVWAVKVESLKLDNSADPISASHRVTAGWLLNLFKPQFLQPEIWGDVTAGSSWKD